MKATEQYFPVVLFIILYKVVLTFESVSEILNLCNHSNESQGAVMYFPVVLFITLNKVVLTFDFVEKIAVNCNHSNESCRLLLSGSNVYVVTGGICF